MWAACFARRHTWPPTWQSILPSERAVAVSGERTNKVAVTNALHEFIARRERRGIFDFTGKLEWDGSFNDKAERSRK